MKNLLVILGFLPSQAKPIDILARSGGRRATDSVEIFSPANIIEKEDSDFNIAEYFFLLHGLSHMKDCAQNLASVINTNNRLYVTHDIQNPVDTKALLLRTKDYCSIGFIPRFLLDDVWTLLDRKTDLVFCVYKVNKPPTPIQQRIVCKLEAKVTKGFVSCSSNIYKPCNKSAVEV